LYGSWTAWYDRTAGITERGLHERGADLRARTGRLADLPRRNPPTVPRDWLTCPSAFSPSSTTAARARLGSRAVPAATRWWTTPGSSLRVPRAAGNRQATGPRPLRPAFANPGALGPFVVLVAVIIGDPVRRRAPRHPSRTTVIAEGSKSQGFPPQTGACPCPKPPGRRGAGSHPRDRAA
jgi:hypothetical protein